MKTKQYYKAVFREDTEHTIRGRVKIFKKGDIFVNRMSDSNLEAYLTGKKLVQIVRSEVITFPLDIFDIYKVTELITFKEEKINSA